MCRLYAQRAAEPAGAHEPLLAETNSLQLQSRRHAHGWGVGWHSAHEPQLRRGVAPAHRDPAFERAAFEARARVVLAHVRDASVGPVALQNTHPFRHGRWLFAHNGTVARMARDPGVRARLEAELAPDLRPRLQGDTDSERLFLLVLGHLRTSTAETPLARVREAFLAIHDLVARVADPGAEKPSSLNFILTDGDLLAGCRRGRPLHLCRRPGFVALSSERIGGGPWVEVPEGGFAGVDASGTVLAPLDPAAREAA